MRWGSSTELSVVPKIARTDCQFMFGHDTNSPEGVPQNLSTEPCQYISLLNRAAAAGSEVRGAIFGVPCLCPSRSHGCCGRGGRVANWLARRRPARHRQHHLKRHCRHLLMIAFSRSPPTPATFGWTTLRLWSQPPQRKPKPCWPASSSHRYVTTFVWVSVE